MGDSPRQGMKHPETALAADRAMPASREADPAVAAEAHDLAARLHRLLAELPPAQAEAIELWCQGFSYRQIGEITGKAPKVELVAKTFENLTFTLDPIAASLQKSADDAVAVGLLEAVDLKGIHDLTLLNEVLAARGQPEVTGL